MISRVAESCFWLMRYLERVENLARVLLENRNFLLDVHPSESIARWEPIIHIYGEQSRYQKIMGQLNETHESENVQEYFVWHEQNRSSIMTTLRAARENARVVRETLSMEMWETINSLWLWLSQGNGREDYNQQRQQFYAHLITHIQVFQGLLENTIRHDEPYAFLKLGMYVERTHQVARIVDISYYTEAALFAQEDHALEDARWMMILKCLCANNAFFRETSFSSLRRAIFEFLFLDRQFPRTLSFCLRQIQALIARLDPKALRLQTLRTIDNALKALEEMDYDQMDRETRHAQVEQISGALIDSCALLQEEYFAHAPHMATSEQG